MSFTGPIANLSAYKMRGIDKIIIRTKGGASKSRIKRHPDFEKTRLLNAEFGGRSSAVRHIRCLLSGQKALADYNFAGKLNALVKPLQDMDTENKPGERSICFSRNPQLLAGFNLNRQTPFDSIIRNPVLFTLSRENPEAFLDIPTLLPGINFFAPEKYPVYSFIATLGILPDLFFHKHGYQSPPAYGQFIYPVVEKTSWYPVLNGAAAETIHLKFDSVPPDNNYSLLLSIGIAFGTITTGNQVQQVKYAGAAKVLAMK